MNRRQALLSAAAFMTVGAIAPAPTSAQTPVPAPDENTIADAYIYLLGRALVIRQEHMDRGAPGFAYNR